MSTLLTFDGSFITPVETEREGLVYHNTVMSQVSVNIVDDVIVKAPNTVMSLRWVVMS